MPQPQIPQRLTDFAAWRKGTQFLGTLDVTLPNLTALSDTISGAGILGEIDSPSIGQYGSLVVGMNWRTLEAAAFDLITPEVQSIDFRGNIQTLNRLSGTQDQIGIRVSIRGVPKGLDLGKLAQNSAMDSVNEIEAHYIKVMIAGKTVLEHDKLNNIHIINGKDYRAAVRANLGL